MHFLQMQRKTENKNLLYKRWYIKGLNLQIMVTVDKMIEKGTDNSTKQQRLQ